MTGVDWHEAGRKAGQEIAEAGGSAANVEVDSIGADLGRAWLDGVLDALREKGLDATMIVVSPALLDTFRKTTEWRDDGTYRGAHLRAIEDDGDGGKIVVAA